MKILKSLFVSALVFSSLTIHAQSSQDMMEEFMRMRKEMFDSIMSDSFNADDFEGRVLEMMKQMDQQMGQGNGIDSWPDINAAVSNAAGANWSETDSTRTLTVKVQQIKDKPLDIKIQNGMITLKGQTQASMGNVKSVSNFQKSYSIPSDVDQSSPEFENTSEQILIKFKKLNPSKIVKNKTIESTTKKPVKESRPKASKESMPKIEERFPIGPGDANMGL